MQACCTCNFNHLGSLNGKLKIIRTEKKCQLLALIITLVPKRDRKGHLRKPGWPQDIGGVIGKTKSQLPCQKLCFRKNTAYIRLSKKSWSVKKPSFIAESCNFRSSVYTTIYGYRDRNHGQTLALTVLFGLYLQLAQGLRKWGAGEQQLTWDEVDLVHTRTSDRSPRIFGLE